MLSRRNFVALTMVAGITTPLRAHAAWWSFLTDDENADGAEAIEIKWDDLIPDDFVQPVNPYESMSSEEIDKLMDGSEESNARIADIDAKLSYAPVVPELDGKRIKMPAYITPLEFSGSAMVQEFLLVPYVGACIHTPPPPANQIVHVESEDPVKLIGMNEPVWATGIIRTDTIQSDLAISGYSLELERIEPYHSRRK